MIDERINDHLQRLNQYYLELRAISKENKEEFLRNNLMIKATERLFQLAIETCINIGNRIISIEQFSKPVTSPETYADIFRELSKLGVVPEEFSGQLINMAKFRNRLVHLYWETEPEELYNFLRNNLEDFPVFADYVVNWAGKTEK